MATREPRIFKRGPDFNLTLVLPSYVTPNHFADYTGTAQIRRYKDDSEDGFIADVDFEWVEEWPLGLAELDIMLEDPDGKKVGTATIFLKIERTITRSVEL
jgi:hypothetical protein